MIRRPVLAIALACGLAQVGHAQSEADAEALFALAQQYHGGQGVLQNFARAADLYGRAAEQGHAGAQGQLARYLYEGLGVARDIPAAMALFESAARAGTAQAQFDYGTALESQGAPDQAAVWYRQAADQGLPAAMVSLGVLHQHGTGVAQDFAQALALYQAAAETEDPRAQNNLGLMYVRGDGVAQDYDRAASLFASAAGQGLREAMTNLGVMYENGFGVPLDEARAASLYRQGAGQGGADSPPGPVYDPRLAPPDASAEGLAQLSGAVRAGDPVAQFQAGWLLVTHDAAAHPELVEAARLFHAAANAGLPAAMANLGLMYFQGRGVPQDFVLGHMWLSLASSAGLSEAVGLNARLSQGMLAAQINEAQALAVERRN